MSPRHFSRVFTKQVGCSPARYVERVRVEAARRRLEDCGDSVDEIARAAGVNKSLLYHYFGNKRSLFLAVLEATYARIRGTAAALELEALPPPAAMQNLVDFTWNYFVEHPEFITLVNSENLNRSEN